MSFRTDDAFALQEQYFIRREISPLPKDKQAEGYQTLERIKELIGRPVGHLPRWHPLVYEMTKAMGMSPLDDGFHYGRVFTSEVADHPYEFEEGLLFLPYGNGRLKEAKSTLRTLGDKNPTLCLSPWNGCVSIDEIDGILHNEACSILVVSHDYWRFEDNDPRSVPYMVKKKLRYVVQTLEDNSWAHVGERWKRMAYYYLGTPHGSRSSLCVDESLGLKIKRLFDAFNKVGYFGPMKKVEAP